MSDTARFSRRRKPTYRFDFSVLPTRIIHGMVGWDEQAEVAVGRRSLSRSCETAGRFVSEQIGLRRPTNHLRNLVPPHGK